MIQLMPPIFLNVEFSKSFVEEYPVCAREKNIVMPYPSTDPNMLRGQTLLPSPFSSSSSVSNAGEGGSRATKVSTGVRRHLLCYDADP